MALAVRLRDVGPRPDLPCASFVESAAVLAPGNVVARHLTRAQVLLRKATF